MSKNNQINGLVLDVTPGDVVNVGDDIRIGARKNSTGSWKITLVIDAPREKNINVDKTNRIKNARQAPE